MQDTVLVRMLHKHRDLALGTVLIRTAKEDRGYRSSPMPIENVDKSKTFGYVFAVDEMVNEAAGLSTAKLVPVEFHVAAKDFAEVLELHPDFTAEFSAYICKKGLQHIFGLSITPDEQTRFIEFSFEAGSIELNESYFAKSFWTMDKDFRLLDSTWRPTTTSQGMRSRSETRCVTFSNGHRETAVGQVESFDDAVKLLSLQGHLRGNKCICV